MNCKAREAKVKRQGKGKEMRPQQWARPFRACAVKKIWVFFLRTVQMHWG